MIELPLRSDIAADYDLRENCLSCQRRDKRKLDQFRLGRHRMSLVLAALGHRLILGQGRSPHGFLAGYALPMVLTRADLLPRTRLRKTAN